MIERTGADAADKDVARRHYKPIAAPPRTPARFRARSRLTPGLLLALGAALVLVRLPSLVQPMGADQGLYAYVGERILRGELPYVHAWDQKPPAIHYTYAAMRAIWASDGVVAAADLAAAAAIAALLFGIGRHVTTRGTGAAAGLIFLLLSNPAFTRLGGVRIRSQCETFIALLITAAVWALVTRTGPALRWTGAAGVCIGLALTFKYNAIVYAAAAIVILALLRRLTTKRSFALIAGSSAAPLAFAAVLAGAIGPLYDATIAYNLQYSGETYTGPRHFITYLLSFPVARSRDDALWTLGCGGCAILLAASRRDRLRLLPVVWVAAACLSIAINGSRGLPQYFVQAAPALALAAAWAGWLLIRAAIGALPRAAARAAVAAGIVVVAVAVWRVNQFPKLVEQTRFDAEYARGRMSREAHLDRYADERKYSARAAAELGRFMREHTPEHGTVLLFGFSGAAYVYAGRASASRFFWSRPVIAGFNEGVSGYGTAGLLADLERSRPSLVALQLRDWAPDVDDSARFFMNTPPLAGWLRAHYRQVEGPEGFDVWLRRE